MAENADTDAESRRQNLTLAKVLLRKFGILHEFHAQQMQLFTIACCNASIAGEASVNPETRAIHYDIKTYRFYKKENKAIIPRHKYSLVGKLKYPKAKYEKEILLAKQNLTAWTKELLWGAETTVTVTVDGK